jgi:hypothetical protein
MGSYVTVLPHVTVYLQLRQDHTYSERLDYADGKHEVVSDTWSWNVAGIECAELRNYRFPKEADGGAASGSEITNLCLPGEKWWSGKTTLPVNEHLGWYFEPEKPGMRDREARYQAALSSYQAALKPGMTREIVEHYLKTKNTSFIETDCVDPDAPFRCGRADLTRIGEEEASWASWVYKRQNIYIAFQFTGEQRPDSTWTSEPWDVLESITIFRRFETRF